MFLCQSSCIQLGLHPTQWLNECRKNKKKQNIRKQNKTKQNFDTDINDVISQLAWSKYEENLLKFICSEKASNFCKIPTVDLSYLVTVKSTVKISQNFVALSEYMNFMHLLAKHIEILEQKETLVLPLLFMMSLVWQGNLFLLLMHLIN